MNTLDFQQKNLEWIKPEDELDKLILETLHFVQGLFNGTEDTADVPEFILDPKDFNAVEYLYKMTQSTVALFTTDQYIQFLNKYNLRDYLDISKL